MNPYEEHADGLGELQAEMDDSCPSINWGQETVDVIPGSAARRGELGAGGFALNADFQCEVLVSSFKDYADAKTLKDDLLNDPIGYLGDGYKVDAVNIRPGGLQLQLVCTAISQQ